MADSDRLLGALEEFKKAQVRANELNRREHHEMMREITRINQWRWKLEGIRVAGAGLLGALGGIVVTLAQRIFHG